MTRVLGIDFGTSAARMAVIEGRRPILIENAEGKESTPSVVFFGQTGERLVGEAARQQAVTNPRNTIFSIKRFMGRKYDEVLEDVRRVPFDVVKAPNGDARVEVDVHGERKQFTPPQIAAMILSKLKADAETRLGETITRAVISVPACYNNYQRQATIDAGRIAGLEVLRLLNEPTAAALACTMDEKARGTLAIYHLGGGTFDVSIVMVQDIVEDRGVIVEVFATEGDTHLGGDDWDARIMDGMFGKFAQEHGTELPRDPHVVALVREEVEKAKIALSTSARAELSRLGTLEGIKTALDRDEMERQCRELTERTDVAVQKCLRTSRKTKDDIDHVVLVGGMTSLPSVVARLRPLAKRGLYEGVHPADAVALGTAIQGGILLRDMKVLVLDVATSSLGVETTGGTFDKIIEHNTVIPARRKQVFTTAVDNQTGFALHVLQGEGATLLDEKSLWRFSVQGIPLGPKGVPKITLTFDLDASGLFSLSAEDPRITVGSEGGLSDVLLNEMRAEVEDFMREYVRTRGLVVPRALQVDEAATPAGRRGGTVIRRPAEGSPRATGELVTGEHGRAGAATGMAARRREQPAQGDDDAGKPVPRRVLKEQYELLSEIGRGGFGAVYKARDIHLEQFVAIKELILENATSLREEAAVLSELRHRNIVGFRQLFPDGERWYMVMDYVDGGSLARLIHRRELYAGEEVLQRTLSIASQTAEGLKCAHEHGVIHQDVKPANVMIARDGTAKVSDFGLAKARPQTAGISPPGGEGTILLSGNGMTPAYCSPEQAGGRRLTRRTDTWSWGLLVVEMFVGDVTWARGELAPRVLKEFIEKGPQAIKVLRMPRPVTALLTRCFQEDPQARPDMGEIIQVLSDLQKQDKGDWLRRLFR